MTDIKKFQEIIGYKYKNENLLLEALTHSSYANESKRDIRNNERLEFLGDSVLSIVVSKHIFNDYKHLPEGELTKLRASLVCEKALFEFSKKIHLGDYILLGKGEELTGGRNRPSIVSDAFEAVIASIYLDGGFEPVEKYIMRFMPKDVIHNKPVFNDFKTVLQEVIQENPEEKVEYILTGETGPDHDKCFEVEVRLNSNVIGKGKGRSKKEAEQMSAKEALKLMGYEYETL